MASAVNGLLVGYLGDFGALMLLEAYLVQSLIGE